MPHVSDRAAAAAGGRVATVRLPREGSDGLRSYGPGTAFPGVFGGEVKLDVALSNGTSGVLTIYCLQGSPPAGKEEGITVNLGSNGQFTKQDGGNTAFFFVS